MSDSKKEYLVPHSPFCQSNEEECNECDHGIVRVKLDFEDRSFVNDLEDHICQNDALEAVLFWAVARIRFLEANTQADPRRKEDHE